MKQAFSPIPKAKVTPELFCFDPYFDPLSLKTRLDEEDLDLLGIQHGHAAYRHADDIIDEDVFEELA